MEPGFLSGGGVKNLSDLFQILLLGGGFAGVLIWAILVVLVWQSVKIGRVIFCGAVWILRKSLVSFGKSNGQVVSTLFFLLSIGLLLNAFRAPLVDRWQYIEQSYLNPTYINSDTSVWALQVYEQKLKKHVGEIEFEIIKKETRKTAAAIGSTPLSIYEVAYSECGLNPFAANVNERGDTVAFGWIQFTPAGCIGTNVGSSQINMKQVKGWGRERNIGAMMEATHSYMVGRSNGIALPASTDVYIAVFAPGMIGKSSEAVLYSAKGAKPRQYWENVGLDGYGLEGDKIIHAGKYRDGKITIQDMRLHLALKKASFLKMK